MPQRSIWHLNYNNYMVKNRRDMKGIQCATLGSSCYDERALVNSPRLAAKGGMITKIIQLASRNQALSELWHMVNILQGESRTIWKSELHISCANYVTNIIVSKVKKSMLATIIGRKLARVRSNMK